MISFLQRKTYKYSNVLLSILILIVEMQQRDQNYLLRFLLSTAPDASPENRLEVKFIHDRRRATEARTKSDNRDVYQISLPIPKAYKLKVRKVFNFK